MEMAVRSLDLEFTRLLMRDIYPASNHRGEFQALILVLSAVMADHADLEQNAQARSQTLLDVDHGHVPSQLRSQMSSDNFSEIKTIVDGSGLNSKKDLALKDSEGSDHVVVDWDGPDDPQNPKKCALIPTIS